MLSLIFGISLVAAILVFLIMGRMIYVLLRKLKDSDQWEQSLHSAIYKAGWMEDYKRACMAAREDIIVRRRSRPHATK